MGGLGIRAAWRALTSEQRARWVEVIGSIVSGGALLAAALVGWRQLTLASRQLDIQALDATRTRRAVVAAELDRRYGEALGLFKERDPSARLAGALELYTLATGREDNADATYSHPTEPPNAPTLTNRRKDIASAVSSAFLAALQQPYPQNQRDARPDSFVRRKTVELLARLYAFRRSAETELQFDMAGARLREVSLANLDLADVNFERADLVGVAFDGARLRNTRFVKAALDNARFDQALDMTNVDFSGARLHDAHFRQVLLVRPKFREACIVRTDFSGATVIDGNFTEAIMLDVNLPRDIRQSRFASTTISHPKVPVGNFELNTGLSVFTDVGSGHNLRRLGEKVFPNEMPFGKLQIKLQPCTSLSIS